VQVNDRWLANYRFEEIRDAVKQAARQPPLAVTFRIKKSLYTHNNNANLFVGGSHNQNHNQNQYDMPSQSATSPIDIMMDRPINNSAILIIIQ